MNTFQEQMLCQPEPLPQPLWDLAREYYRRTEAFDRTVCTGPVTRDGIMPVNPRELATVNRNAMAVLGDVRRKAKLEGFTIEQLAEAMRAYDRSSQAAADMRADFPTPAGEAMTTKRERHLSRWYEPGIQSVHAILCTPAKGETVMQTSARVIDALVAQRYIQPCDPTATECPRCKNQGCHMVRAVVPASASLVLTSCACDNDGDCVHALCPQHRDNEPAKSGRPCPLYVEPEYT